MLIAKTSQDVQDTLLATLAELEISALPATNAISNNPDAVLTVLELKNVSQVELACLVLQTMNVKTSQPAEKVILVLLVEAAHIVLQLPIAKI